MDVPDWLDQLVQHTQLVGDHVGRAAQGLNALWSLHQPGGDGACGEDGKPWPCGTANLVAYWLELPLTEENEQ